MTWWLNWLLSCCNFNSSLGFLLFSRIQILVTWVPVTPICSEQHLWTEPVSKERSIVRCGKQRDLATTTKKLWSLGNSQSDGKNNTQLLNLRNKESTNRKTFLIWKKIVLCMRKSWASSDVDWGTIPSHDTGPQAREQLCPELVNCGPLPVYPEWCDVISWSPFQGGLREQGRRCLRSSVLV